jgi:hypothetical protein
MALLPTWLKLYTIGLATFQYQIKPHPVQFSRNGPSTRRPAPW